MSEPKFHEVACLSPVTLLKKRHGHKCFHVHFMTFSRTSLVAASRRGGGAYFFNKKIGLLRILLIEKLQSSDKKFVTFHF